MNLLEVRNICKTYGSGETSVKALKDVSFSVPRILWDIQLQEKVPWILTR